MTYKEVAWATSLVVLLAILAGVDYSHGRCRFPAIYNFGDSNSDTGGRSASLGVLSPPYAGVTFFHKPSGRYCDGRLVVDFIAEDLGLPYLSAYLDSIGTSFRHGANFATAGSSIRPGGYSPFHLAIQVSQFIRFKSRATLLQDHHGLTGLLSSLSLWWLGKLPRPDDFSKALYMIDIGQNDLFSGLQHNAPEQVLASVPDILNQFISALQDLYKEGARSFWIHNTGPVGCLPYSVNYHGSKSGRLDQIGCVEAQNNVAREFNRQLKERLDNLSLEHPQACITHFDMYTAKYELFSRAKKQGLTDPFGICCGSFNSHQHTMCGELAAVNGTLCRDPSKYVSWDGIHYSEASNRQIASHIVDGSLSTPPVSIRNACRCMHL